MWQRRWVVSVGGRGSGGLEPDAAEMLESRRTRGDNGDE